MSGRRAALSLGIAVAAALAPAVVRAQAARIATRGDSLLAAGRADAAESAFYEAARLRPRDPPARLALGRYLASRGALRVGAVLMEEARYFGGDPATVAVELAPVYERLGDWKALAALPSPPIGAGEHARAAWLADHTPSPSGPDEVTVPYTADAAHPLGRLTLRVGTVEVTADVDPTVRGLVLPPFVFADPHAGVRTFGAEATRQPAVAAAVRLGTLSLGNLPATVDQSARVARVGLDLLGALAPTFDAASRTATLRKAGRVPADAPGTRVPTFVSRDGAALIVGGALVPLSTQRAQTMLGGARWTWDARRGLALVTR